MAPVNSGLSRIEVVVSYTSLAVIYSFFTPSIVINGQTHRLPWGKHSFELPPGRYEISISYPWLFMSECGKSTVHVDLRSGEKKRVTYCAGLIRYLPGKISVESIG
jgi:hypothetical protein